MPTWSPSRYHKLAETCRRKARVSHKRIAAELDSMADEYEAKARELENGEPQPPPATPVKGALPLHSTQYDADEPEAPT